MKPPYSTRRQHPRFSVDIRVGVSVAKATFDARTRDISRAGLCLVAMQPIPRETEIGLELVLTFGSEATSEPLHIVGRVAWCTFLFGHYQIGVKFVNVDDEQKRYLDMFLGFLDGTLAASELFPDEEDARAVDPDDPFAA